jgi:methyl-accepting chemotaxis protein
MEKIRQRRKLRNFLINRDVQIKVALFTWLEIVVALGIIMAVVLAPFYHDIFRSKDIFAQRDAAGFFVILLDRLGLAMIIIFAVIFVTQIVMTHKICGPLINFGHTLGRIRQKDLTREVRLRKYDFLKPEAAQINAMQAALADAIDSARDLSRALRAVIGQADTEAMSPDERRHWSDTVREEAERLHEVLSAFETPGSQQKSKCPVH